MDSYSKIVSFLRVALPVSALLLLSALFLFSRASPDLGAPNITSPEGQERLNESQATSPFFSGANTNGDRYSISSDKVLSLENEHYSFTTLNVELNYAEGGGTTLTADEAIFNLRDQDAALRGEVHVTMSTGMKITTDLLVLDLADSRLTAPGPLVAQLPLGRLEAGAMEFSGGESPSSRELIFTNGVQLLYLPQDPEKER